MTDGRRKARPEHPVVVRLREHRNADMQLRVADVITRFAGSMAFVYIHVVVFALWMVFPEPLRRAGGRAEDEHRTHPRDPRAVHRAAAPPALGRRVKTSGPSDAGARLPSESRGGRTC
jgi:hypothetical protein